MTFQKVVKAPAKRAHIKNCPRKKSEWQMRRKGFLLRQVGTLADMIFVLPGKLEWYVELKDTIKELRDIEPNVELQLREVLVTARWKWERARMGFF